MELGHRVNRRSFAAAILAIPVLARVYLRAAAPRAPAWRFAIAATSIVAVAVAAASARPDTSQAIGHGGTPAVATFRPVALAGLTRSEPAGAPIPGLGVVPIASSAPDAPPVDRTAEALQTGSEAVAPEVVRFRPRDGSRGVEAPHEVSVRFSRSMDRAATAAVFSVEVDGAAWTGRARWAEDDTVLVVRLARRLPAGARVRLAVSGAARSVIGMPIAAAAAATFTVAIPPPVPRPSSRPAATPRPPATVYPSPSGWGWPLIGPITQRFGQSLTKYGYHQGIDIDGDTGDPVRAAHSGRVTLAGTGDACGGIEVHIEHGSGLETWYRHLSAVAVRVGQQLERGHVVGRVGDTGCSLGSHLHFAVRRDGEFVDPLRYLPAR